MQDQAAFLVVGINARVKEPPVNSPRRLCGAVWQQHPSVAHVVVSRRKWLLCSVKRMCEINRQASCPGNFFQMTEQRKQKQRIGLLGHPPNMNVNPQQPAWGRRPTSGRAVSCADLTPSCCIQNVRLTGRAMRPKQKHLAIYKLRCFRWHKGTCLCKPPFTLSLSCLECCQSVLIRSGWVSMTWPSLGELEMLQNRTGQRPTEWDTEHEVSMYEWDHFLPEGRTVFNVLFCMCNMDTVICSHIDV